MKKFILLVVCTTLIIKAQAQILLEHEYPSAALVRLNEKDYGYQYFDSTKVYLHDLNHKLIKTIPLWGLKA
jgi:hypothetical protein